MAKFLDATGLSHLVAKLKTIFAVKATTLSGYGITNGVTGVGYSGSGNVVSGGSVSGHTLTLTRGVSAPVTRRVSASNTESVSNYASHELLILDASALSYTAGKEFWVNILQADRTLGYGHYLGYVLTGGATCFVKFGGVAAYGVGGSTQLAANSVYRFELLGYGKNGTNYAKGYVQWQRLGAL